MDLVKQYIKEIKSVKEVPSRELEEKGVYMHTLETIYEVQLLAGDNDDTVRLRTLYFTESRWEKVQEQGYFLA